MKPVVMSSPLDASASIDSDGLRLVAGAGVEGEHAVGERSAGPAVLRSATSATRLTDSISAALSTTRDGLVLGGEQAADLGELAVEQPGRRTTRAAGPRPRSR